MGLKTLVVGVKETNFKLLSCHGVMQMSARTIKRCRMPGRISPVLLLCRWSCWAAHGTNSCLGTLSALEGRYIYDVKPMQTAVPWFTGFGRFQCTMELFTRVAFNKELDVSG